MNKSLIAVYPGLLFNHQYIPSPQRYFVFHLRQIRKFVMLGYQYANWLKIEQDMSHTSNAEGSFFRRADPATKARFDDVVSLSVHLLINLRLTTAMSR